jgi:hypothetical protein
MSLHSQLLDAIATPPNFREMWENERLLNKGLHDQVKELRQSLRDQFAMAALTGFITSNPEFIDCDARAIYEIADAMLEARKELL